jgi:hypothetical protein
MDELVVRAPIRVNVLVQFLDAMAAGRNIAVEPCEDICVIFGGVVFGSVVFEGVIFGMIGRRVGRFFCCMEGL